MENKVLLVDDEEDIRDVLRIFLSEIGYAVLTAGDGENALSLLEKEKPAIVLTDIKMPGIDGIELLQTIKARAPDTEVIMITGHGDMDLAILSLQHEATDFITKPIDHDVLEFSLRRARERFSMRRRLREYTEDLERLVREKTRQLIDAERFAAIGEAVASLSHGIKNIAGGLRGGLFVLKKGIELENRTYLEQGWGLVSRNVDTIKNLSLDLLDFGKAGVLSLQTGDPNGPARNACSLMGPRAEEEGISLTVEVDSTLRPFPFDAEAIDRSLLNLVTNAIDACKAVEDRGGNRWIAVRTLSRKGWGVEYQVEDSGAGMDAPVRKKIFQSVFTTKGNRGTGIGLMITKKAIDRHGGTIEVESAPGRGTLFIIRLPKAPPGAEAAS
jgi:signal transduction histidine kinase